MNLISIIVPVPIIWETLILRHFPELSRFGRIMKSYFHFKPQRETRL